MMKVPSYQQNSTDHLDLPPFRPDNSIDLSLQKQIGQSRFPVFCYNSPSYNKAVAIKLFSFDREKLNHAYLNESRFSRLAHQNIIQFLGSVDSQAFSFRECQLKASCIFMEFAPFGDFCDIISTYPIYQDDKLVRTFFHQLVEGVKYLHSQNIGHLDIKLDNLLLGDDLNLKITDFDMGYVKGDHGIKGRGTANYRAPEIKEKRCLNAFAADIYSVGIVLFMLKTGYFPYTEDCTDGEENSLILLRDNVQKFWEVQERIYGEIFTQDFKKLFELLVMVDPKFRGSIEEIEENQWFKEPIYEKDQVLPAMLRLEIPS